ncbi:MAG: LysR family transcriptional regulator [Deltaproteobacteria bacterium]|nr:LysR family transcriptional regulator [Deltaproteobacteria bacterium]
MSLDWRDLSLLLALRRAKNLAGAARALNVDATTVGRRIKVIEQAVGTPLVKRVGRGLALTEAGESLATVAESTERGIAEVQRRVALEDEAPRGVVRLTTMDVLASRFVAPAVPRLLAEHPGLLLEIDTSLRVLDLSRGEADISLRLQKPEQEGLIARQIGVVTLSPYVSSKWATHVKKPSSIPQVLFGLRFSVAEGDWLRQQLPEGPIALRTDNVSTALSAVKAGVGLGLLPDVLADGLVKIELTAPGPSRPVWLSMHPTSARQKRVKTVVRFLAETFGAFTKKKK